MVFNWYFFLIFLILLLGAYASVPGMDVSSYQGNVNWAAAYGNGARFAYIKATEGTSYTNPYFSQQYTGSYEQGMIRGAYHYARPDNSDGASQATYFASHGGGWSPDGKTLPGALDIESPCSSCSKARSCYNLSNSQMAAWIRSFAETYKSITGVYPVIYTTAAWYNTCVGTLGDLSSTCPMWIAQWSSRVTKLPYSWGYYTFWQFSDHGKFPGDQDVFNGDYTQLQKLAMG